MCTSILCGKNATDKGVVMIARNEDYPQNNWNKYIRRRETAPYSKQDLIWTLGNGLRVPAPKTWYSYYSVPDAQGQEEGVCSVGDHFFYEACGINEVNVAVSATNSLQMNDKAAQADPTVDCGLEESVITTLILPQAKNARQAAALLGGYVTEYGATEADGILLADQNEAWYLEIGSGHHWIAVRVPDDKYLVVANSMRIHHVDLTDTKHVICSEGLYDFVCEKGLLERPDEKDFDFASAFGQQGASEDGKIEPYYNIDRLWLAQRILTPSHRQEIRKEVYPMFLKPDSPVTPDKIMEVLRATYAGTELAGKNATRPIGVVRTTESHILVLDSSMPGRLKGMAWQAIGSPLFSVYVPFYAVIDAIPEAYACGDSTHYEEHSVYWAWKTLFALYGALDQKGREELLRYRDDWQQHFIGEQARMRGVLKRLGRKDDVQAENLAKTYSVGNLSRMAQSVTEKCRETLVSLVGLQQDIFV